MSLRNTSSYLIYSVSNPVQTNVLSFYRKDYGFLGPTLHQGVIKARTAPPPTPASTSASASVANVSIVTTTAGTPARPQTPLTGASKSATPVSSGPIQRQSSQGGPSTGGQQQKFVIVGQRQQTPSPSQGKLGHSFDSSFSILQQLTRNVFY